MSQNLKIKSIIVIKDFPGYKAGYELINLPKLSQYPWTFEEVKNNPEFFKIEYEPEKPKSNVLFAVKMLEYGQIYYYIDENGDYEESTWFNTGRDIARFNLNNVFLTKENAQKQADRNQLLAKIERFAVENNDWRDKEEGDDTYAMCRNEEISTWGWLANTTAKVVGATYFSSEELIEKAISKFKDRLDILLD
jgi:hypothetical protein